MLGVDIDNCIYYFRTRSHRHLDDATESGGEVSSSNEMTKDEPKNETPAAAVSVPESLPAEVPVEDSKASTDESGLVPTPDAEEHIDTVEVIPQEGMPEAVADVVTVEVEIETSSRRSSQDEIERTEKESTMCFAVQKEDVETKSNEIPEEDLAPVVKETKAPIDEGNSQQAGSLPPVEIMKVNSEEVSVGEAKE